MIIAETPRPIAHEIGQCLSDRNNKLLYINIAKNASTWTKEYFVKGYKWNSWDNFIRFPVIRNFHKLVILRDPYERWLSGIVTYLMREQVNLNLSNESIKLLLTKIEFDEHTWPQTRFLSGLDTGDCTFFKFDHDLQKNIQNFMDIKKQIKSDTFNLVNNLERNSLDAQGFGNYKKTIDNFIHNNKRFYERLVDHYKDDYNLITKVKFYQIKI